jgi:hypothetical protein
MTTLKAKKSAGMCVAAAVKLEGSHLVAPSVLLCTIAVSLVKLRIFLHISWLARSGVQRNCEMQSVTMFKQQQGLKYQVRHSAFLVRRKQLRI